jgi:single-stranded DNA-binding protein
MNQLLATGTYVGEHFLDNGLRFMQINITNTGKSGSDVPLYIVPNKAAGESFDAFTPGTHLLVGGRMYPSRQDYKMYVIPNQPLQVVTNNLNINQVNLSGGVGYIPDQPKEDLFNFSLMCSAPAQMILNHTWQDSLGFRVESWGDDAKRLDSLLFVGRQMSLCGTLRFNTWKAQDGSQRSTYQVRVRSSLYTVFGENKKRKEAEAAKAASNPVTVAPLPAQQGPNPPMMGAGTPCSVNTDNVPF